MSTTTSKIPTDTNELLRQISQHSSDGDISGAEQLRTALVKQGLERPVEYTDAMRKHEELVKQYAGTPYEELLKNNSYANLTYTPNWVDRIFGPVTSGWTKWINDRDSNLSSEDAKILATKFENEYNSESSKVDRMRSAGENPDLLGTGSVSDSADIPVDETPLDGSTTNPANLMQGISNIGAGFRDTLRNAFSFALQYMSGMQSMESTGLDMINKAFTFADSAADSFITKEDIANPSEGVKRLVGLFGNRTVDGILSEFGEFDGLSFRSKSVRTAFAKAIQRKFSSADFWNKILEKRKTSSGNIFSIGTTEGNPNFRPSIDATAKAMNKYLKSRMDSEMALFKLQLENSKYQSEFYQNKSGKFDATFENLSKGLHLQSMRLDNAGKSISNRNNTIQGGLLGFQYKQQKLINDMYSSSYDLMSDISKNAKGGDKFSQYLLIGMSLGDTLLDKASGLLGKLF